MSKLPLNLDAPAKVWIGPDFEDARGGMGSADIVPFDRAEDAVRYCIENLGARRSAARIETVDGVYGQEEINTIYAQMTGDAGKT